MTSLDVRSALGRRSCLKSTEATLIMKKCSLEDEQMILPQYPIVNIRYYQHTYLSNIDHLAGLVSASLKSIPSFFHTSRTMPFSLLLRNKKMVLNLETRGRYSRNAFTAFWVSRSAPGRKSWSVWKIEERKSVSIEVLAREGN